MTGIASTMSVVEELEACLVMREHTGKGREAAKMMKRLALLCLFSLLGAGAAFAALRWDDFANSGYCPGTMRRVANVANCGCVGGRGMQMAALAANWAAAEVAEDTGAEEEVAGCGAFNSRTSRAITKGG